MGQRHRHWPLLRIRGHTCDFLGMGTLSRRHSYDSTVNVEKTSSMVKLLDYLFHLRQHVNDDILPCHLLPSGEG